MAHNESESVYRNRRRIHGESLERLVLDELIDEGILQPVQPWGCQKYIGTHQQKFFPSRNGTSPRPLDEVAVISPAHFGLSRTVIVEVKAMRLLNWNEFKDHGLMHMDIVNQNAAHRHIANEYGLQGTAIIALNKDSSELMIRTYDLNGDPIPELTYDY